MSKFTTFTESGLWYASEREYHPDAPVGEGETEEDAILDLQHKLNDLAEEARNRHDARHDEP